MVEISVSRLNILDELNQARPPVDPHAAASRIDIGPNDREIALLCVRRNGSRLVLDRIALSSVDIRTYCAARSAFSALASCVLRRTTSALTMDQRSGSTRRR
jgi:hypothetical protein